MSLMVLNLHSAQCTQSEINLRQMGEILQRDPDALGRRAEFSFCGQLTPLQSAIYRKHEVCAEFLIDRGADVNAVTGTGCHTALYIAVYKNCLPLVELLLKRGASTNCQLQTYANPKGDQTSCRSWYFHLAATFDFQDIAQKLVEFGSETEDFDEHTGLPILYAAEIAAVKASPEILLLALQYGSNNTKRAVSEEISLVMGPSLVLSTFINKWPINPSRLITVWTVLSKFGHSFWCKDRKGRDAMGLISRKRARNCVMDPLNVPDSFFDELTKALEEFMRTPLRLQDICRIAIRRQMGRGAQSKIDQITGIPAILKRFLKVELL
ncbi:ankyrin repeat and SOCS box protein 13-like [Neocloeon triangulifer]|uniref:ankyrin repeat and SOCS box protein 13-like n=1 Tax=Neocloeon triangulifer TaxID=2078957 RepID=UPI00286FAC93|nr:ankyrin repeat and SOCS box protein 13-like [Neocloeon triangulifer]